MDLHSHTYTIGNLGILAASCAGICSPCKLYDVQCLGNIPIRVLNWELLSRKSGSTPRCPAMLNLWLSDYAVPFCPNLSPHIFPFPHILRPAGPATAVPRSGLAEDCRPNGRPRSLCPPFPVPCATFSSSRTAMTPSSPHHHRTTDHHLLYPHIHAAISARQLHFPMTSLSKYTSYHIPPSS